VLYFQEIAALKNEIKMMKAHHDDEIKRLVQLQKVTHAPYDYFNILMYMVIAYNHSQTAD
jgi:hypothetical protein